MLVGDDEGSSDRDTSLLRSIDRSVDRRSQVSFGHTDRGGEDLQVRDPQRHRFGTNATQPHDSLHEQTHGPRSRSLQLSNSADAHDVARSLLEATADLGEEAFGRDAVDVREPVEPLEGDPPFTTFVRREHRWFERPRRSRRCLAEGESPFLTDITQNPTDDPGERVSQLLRVPLEQIRTPGGKRPSCVVRSAGATPRERIFRTPPTR